MSNKAALTIRLIAYILIFVIVLALAGWMILGEELPVFNFGDNSRRNFEGTALTSAQSFSGVREIETDLVSYSVEIVEYDGAEVQIEFVKTGTGSAKEPLYKFDNGELSIAEESRGFGINLGSGRVVISVPRGEIYDYSLDSVSGSISVGARADELKLETVSGSIEALCGGKSADVGSTSGSIRLRGIFERVNAESSSGSVRVVAGEITERISCDTVSGSIRIALDGATGYALEASSVSGSIKDEYHGYSGERSVEFEWGDGSTEIEAQSVSGSIRLADWS